jgi:hypothetical protein
MGDKRTKWGSVISSAATPVEVGLEADFAKGPFVVAVCSWSPAAWFKDEMACSRARRCVRGNISGPGASRDVSPTLEFGLADCRLCPWCAGAVAGRPTPEVFPRRTRLSALPSGRLLSFEKAVLRVPEWWGFKPPGGSMPVKSEGLVDARSRARLAAASSFF